MADFKTGMNEAVLKYLLRNDIDAAAVIDIDDRTEYGGYCETCSYEYVVVDITYLDSNGKSRTYTYDSSFASFIGEL